MSQEPADEVSAPAEAAELCLDEAESVHASGNQVLDESCLSSPDLDAESAELGRDLLADVAAGTDVAPPDQAFVELTGAVDTLGRQVGAFHARAESYEQIIRQMQARIEKLQGDQVQALLKPVIQRFAGLHSQAIDGAERARVRGEAAEKDFSFFAVAIEESLGLVDIESVGASPSELFDAGKHHAARVVPTQELDLDKRIERVLQQGFTYVGAQRVFLPARVSVYRFEEPPPSELDSQSPISDKPEGSEGATSE